jgi:hypothetical protein
MIENMYDFKYDKKSISAIISSIKVLERELGPIGKEKLINMLDAFDPELKLDILTFYVIGESSCKMVFNIGKKENTKREDRKIINAIKEVRSISGLGLREAKDIIDEVENKNGFVELRINRDFEHDYSIVHDNFIKSMYNWGYEVV